MSMMDPMDPRNGFLFPLPEEATTIDQAYLTIQPWSEDNNMALINSDEFETLYANQFSGIDPVPMAGQLKKLFDESPLSLTNTNLREQIAQVMERYDGDSGPWYVTGDESNLIIHNHGGPAEGSGIIYKYQEEFGEVLEVKIANHDVYGGTAVAKSKLPNYMGEQTNIDILPGPDEGIGLGVKPIFTRIRIAPEDPNIARPDNIPDRYHGVPITGNYNQYQLDQLTSAQNKNWDQATSQVKALRDQARAKEAVLKQALKSKPKITAEARTAALDAYMKEVGWKLEQEGRMNTVDGVKWQDAMNIYTRKKEGINVSPLEEQTLRAYFRSKKISVDTQNQNLMTYFTKSSTLTALEFHLGSQQGTLVSGLNRMYPEGRKLRFSPELRKKISSGYVVTKEEFRQLWAGKIGDKFMDSMYKDFYHQVYTNQRWRNSYILGYDIAPNEEGSNIAKSRLLFGKLENKATIDAYDLYTQQENTLSIVEESLNKLATDFSDALQAGGRSANAALNKARRAKLREIQVSLRVIGRPSLCADTVITLLNIGARYSGKWYVKTCIHQIDGSGYSTSLTLTKNKQTATLTRTSKISFRSEDENSTAMVSATVVNRAPDGNLVEVTASKEATYLNRAILEQLSISGDAKQVAAAQLLINSGKSIYSLDSEGNAVINEELINKQVEQTSLEARELVDSQRRKLRRTKQINKAIEDSTELLTQVSQVNVTNPETLKNVASSVDKAMEMVNGLKSNLTQLKNLT